MTTTFMTSPQLFFTSESVTEGHPDKMCDQISDAVLDAIFEADPYARVACETAITTGLVCVMGEITTNTYVDIADIARETIKEIGYTRAKYGFDHETCGVIVSIKEQSADIAMGVDKALEAKEGALQDDLDTGAGDQGMMIGFACNETEELMPLSISLAQKLCKQLTDVRKNGTVDYLRPDGKSQVTVEYAYGKPKRIDTIVVSTQHSPDAHQEDIRKDIIAEVITPIVPHDMIDDDTKIYVNPTGRFVIVAPWVMLGLPAAKSLLIPTAVWLVTVAVLSRAKIQRRLTALPLT